MWAQKFKDCFPRGKPEPDPNAHLRQERVQVGHYLVPPELVEEYKARLAAGVDVPAPARYPEHTAFCCGSAHNCRQPEKSCAMRGDVLGREHERGRPSGVTAAQPQQEKNHG